MGLSLLPQERKRSFPPWALLSVFSSHTSRLTDEAGLNVFEGEGGSQHPTSWICNSTQMLRILGKEIVGGFSQGLLQKLSCTQKVLPGLCSGDPEPPMWHDPGPQLWVSGGALGKGKSLSLQCLSCTKWNDLGLNR